MIISSKWEHKSGWPGKLMLFTKHKKTFVKMIVIARSFTLLHGHETNCVHRLKSETDMSDFQNC